MKSSKDDGRGGGPGARVARTWAVSTTSGEVVRGYLPWWAEDDPSRTGVRPDRLHLELAAIGHQANRGGLIVPVTQGVDPATDAGVLVVTIDCRPFGEDGDPELPVVNVQVVDDWWITDLDPAGVTDLGRRLRALADRLTDAVAPELAAAREDWAARHRTDDPTG
ncbi:hypothetical protein VSR01_10275 [Actinacidiphila sp. DG2A-62]|uniref:DUF6907 domain-containing protein n=1 Tax=Actinacidiphila sp. DG2A-62 TaxID=3108821 RepID=UPI002DB9EF59|nr:hypothetical protein [Actinacidiphila sp. DG2A-62]MEC3993906.1 hypothetical protein [Actinacidiphila sp. DG2A-62]